MRKPQRNAGLRRYVEVAHLLALLLLLLPAIQPAQAGFCDRAYRAIFARSTAVRLGAIHERLRLLDQATEQAHPSRRSALFHEMDELWNERARLTGSYQTIRMRAKYLGEDTDAGAQARGLQRVSYFGREYRARLEVKVDGQGLIRRADGSLFSSCPQSEACRPAIFVMDADGRIFVYDGPLRGKHFVRHSSILGGGPVAAAGEIEIRAGRILRVSPSSGHYRPPLDVFLQFIHELEARGVPRPKVHMGALWPL